MKHITLEFVELDRYSGARGNRCVYRGEGRGRTTRVFRMDAHKYALKYGQTTYDLRRCLKPLARTARRTGVTCISRSWRHATIKVRIVGRLRGRGTHWVDKGTTYAEAPRRARGSN